MAQKVLWQTALTDLSVTDQDGIGNLRYEDDGRVYRYIKNVGATALVRYGSCLKALTTVIANVNKGCRSPDFVTATGATAAMNMPAGVPVTAMAKSGSAITGAFGYVQVAGPARVNMLMSDTTVCASTVPGRLSIATGLIATAGWTPPGDSHSNQIGVRLVQKLATGTAGAVRSASVEVACL